MTLKWVATERSARCVLANAKVVLDKAGWHDHIEAFKHDVFPLFAEHGLTFAEALILWELNTVNNGIRSIHDELEGA